MLALFIFLTLKLPFYVIEPKLKVEDSVVIVSIKSDHLLKMPNIYFSGESEITQNIGIEIFEPKYLHNIWYRDTADTFFEFKIKKIRPNEVYFYQIEATDVDKGKEITTRGYKFRVIEKNGRWQEGIVIDIGPYLGNLTEDGITVAWKTNLPTKGEVILENGKTYRSTNESTWHRVRISGLKYGKSYVYRIRCTTENDTFETRPYRFKIPDPYNFKFSVFGDTRASWKTPGTRERINGVNTAILRRIAIESYRDSAAFMIVVGDLIRGYTEDTSFVRIMYETWLWAIEPVSPFLPVFTVVGNHDAGAPLIRDSMRAYYDPPPPLSAENFWLKYFPNPENGPENPDSLPPYRGNVYSFKIGQSLFVVLNTDYDQKVVWDTVFSVRLDKIQFEWADSLMKSVKVPYKFVFWHEPLLPSGAHRGSALDMHPEAQDSAAALLFNHGITALFNAHEHIYARVRVKPDYFQDSKIFQNLLKKPEADSFYQLICGGGGAPSGFRETARYVEKFNNEYHYGIVEITDRTVKFVAKNLLGWKIDEACLSGCN